MYTVLWVCNVPLTIAAQGLNLDKQVEGGWLNGLNNALQIYDVNIIICAPGDTKEILQWRENKRLHYVIPRNHFADELCHIMMQHDIDLIHVQGLEYDYSLKLLRSRGNIPAIVSVQGIRSFISKHYMGYMTISEQLTTSFRDLLRLDPMLKQQSTFAKNVRNEKAILDSAKNVIGRTSWDKACTKLLAPNINYYHVDECLRDGFYDYTSSRSIKNKKHTIFMSQGTYPVKGLHLVIKMLPEILKKFPDTELRVAGRNIAFPESINKKITQMGYGKYLRKLISDLKLSQHISFLGTLNEDEMIMELMNAEVFISASSIENSPNSVAEAAMIGTPIISSAVGGVPEWYNNYEEILSYPPDEYYLIPSLVEEVFDKPELANIRANKAKTKAEARHNPKSIAEKIYMIYSNLIGRYE